MSGNTRRPRRYQGACNGMHACVEFLYINPKSASSSQAGAAYKYVEQGIWTFFPTPGEWGGSLLHYIIQSPLYN